MSLILYLIIGPVLWCAYTAWAARHFNPYSIMTPTDGEFICGLFLSAILWPLGVVIGLVCAAGSWLYDLLTQP